MTDPGIRRLFVKKFGEAQAKAVEAAAESHANGVNSKNRGGDEFKWALIICLGFECLSRDAFREYHGIESSWEELDSWIIAFGDLGSHTGDVNYLSMLTGEYDKYLEKETKQ